VRGRTGESVGQQALRTHRHAFAICFKKHSKNLSYDFTPRTVIVFERVLTLLAFPRGA
jgi:hypothetical protein